MKIKKKSITIVVIKKLIKLVKNLKGKQIVRKFDGAVYAGSTSSKVIGRRASIVVKIITCMYAILLIFESVYTIYCMYRLGIRNPMWVFAVFGIYLSTCFTNVLVAFILVKSVWIEKSVKKWVKVWPIIQFFGLNQLLKQIWIHQSSPVVDRPHLGFTYALLRMILNSKYSRHPKYMEYMKIYKSTRQTQPTTIRNVLEQNMREEQRKRLENLHAKLKHVDPEKLYKWVYEGNSLIRVDLSEFIDRFRIQQEVTAKLSQKVVNNRSTRIIHQSTKKIAAKADFRIDEETALLVLKILKIYLEPNKGLADNTTTQKMVLSLRGPKNPLPNTLKAIPKLWVP